MRRASAVDSNQAEIVAALRKVGCSVQSLASVGNGCPDLAVGYRGRNLFFEVKDGRKVPSKRKLTPLEAEWHAAWRGEVFTVLCREDAFRVLEATMWPQL